MKKIPQEPVICLSFVNTHLRDSYKDLKEFCSAFDVEEEELTGKLNAAGYFYSRELNQFR